MMVIDPQLLAAWVTESCDEQGVPVFVSDPGVLIRVRALVGAGGTARGGPAAAGTRAGRRP